MHRHPTLAGLLVLLSLCGACSDASSTNSAPQDSGTVEAPQDGGTVEAPQDGGTVEAPCTSVFEGDYFLKDQAALEEIVEHCCADGCTVKGSLSIYDSSLSSFELPQITAVGDDLSVLNNDSLSSFSLPNLSSVGDFVMVESNEVLTSFDLPALSEVGRGKFDNIWVKHNDALSSFDLSALTRVSGSLFVRFNRVLSSFDLSALTGLGGFLGLTDNDALPQCLVDGLVAQVEAGEGIGDGVDPTGGPNNPSCSCEDVAGVLQATCP